MPSLASARGLSNSTLCRQVETMQTPTPPPSLKRKRRSRPLLDNTEPSPTRVKTKGQGRTACRDSTSVAGDMQRLELQGTEAKSANQPRVPLAKGEEVWTSPPTNVDNPNPVQCEKDYKLCPLPPISDDLFSSSSTSSLSSVGRTLSLRPAPNEIPETPSPSPTTPLTQGTADALQGQNSSSSIPTLWWSETDLTGQTLDTQDSGDDGEGINGIGFMPTPAIAYARSEKRRRQLKDWKERESREARIRRGERRRKGDSEVSSRVEIGYNELGNEKKVRFTHA
ncbi:uncharacterized protein KY384_005909 [Bacidia gigantensis]|uniref:uncharacterized protein n=1 Tax=Bacidia gigantensis TaxID=2732470 RepID=UPI001D050AF3|nr:uncharacterized protein KY384_005909 [Bacidia gigantensis]KAG8529274.1 hypothetical protein KY384_005909 [Bacidia gigantensis]